MTKEQYFEMCRVLGEEPIEEDIPVDESELCDEGRLALQVYRYLPDIWGEMTGQYIGKNLASLEVIFEILGVTNKYLKKDLLLMIKLVDGEMSDIISAKIKAETEAAKAKSGGKRGR